MGRPPGRRHRDLTLGRANSTAALERRIRRLAQRRGLSLLIAHKRTPAIDAHGGYMLRDDASLAIVFGNRGYDFSADLEEVEAWLSSQNGDTKDGFPRSRE
jgi:hypothetical protein